MSETDVVALMVSGNDLYRRYGKVGSSEQIILDVMSAVDDCGPKTRRRVVIGMLPRRGPSKVALSKNISINQRLADMCTAEGVFFVNPYASFFGRNDFYLRDGVHLSPKGKAVLSNLVEDAIRRCQRSIRPRVEKTPRQYTRVSPETSFADVLKKGTARDVADVSVPGNGRG